MKVKVKKFSASKVLTEFRDKLESILDLYYKSTHGSVVDFDNIVSFWIPNEHNVPINSFTRDAEIGITSLLRDKEFELPKDWVVNYVPFRKQGVHVYFCDKDNVKYLDEL